MPQLDRQAVAALAGRSVSTVRGWERRGLVHRAGADERGRATYRVAGAAREIAKRRAGAGQSARGGTP